MSTEQGYYPVSYSSSQKFRSSQVYQPHRFQQKITMNDNEIDTNDHYNEKQQNRNKIWKAKSSNGQNFSSGNRKINRKETKDYTQNNTNIENNNQETSSIQRKGYYAHGQVEAELCENTSQSNKFEMQKQHQYVDTEFSSPSEHPLHCGHYEHRIHPEDKFHVEEFHVPKTPPKYVGMPHPQFLQNHLLNTHHSRYMLRRVGPKHPPFYLVEKQQPMKQGRYQRGNQQQPSLHPYQQYVYYAHSPSQQANIGYSHGDVHLPPSYPPFSSDQNKPSKRAMYLHGNDIIENEREENRVESTLWAKGFVANNGVWYPYDSRPSKKNNTKTRKNVAQELISKAKSDEKKENTTLTLRIIKQIEYWLSDDNLSKDNHLRSLMSSDGFVAVSQIAQFPKLKNLCSDENQIVEACRLSKSIEVDSDGKKIRKKKFQLTNQIPEDISNLVQNIEARFNKQQKRKEEKMKKQIQEESNDNNKITQEIKENECQTAAIQSSSKIQTETLNTEITDKQQITNEQQSK